MSGSDAGFVGEVLGPGGLLEARHPAYEARPSQIRMAEAVAGVFDAGGALLVEAPPGTGKTFAYLVPAVDAGRTVVVSTGTRTLQDQLYGRDIPLLASALGRPIRAALMKGRENYLCLQRLEEATAQRSFAHGLGSEDRARFETIRDWAGGTGTGDRSEVPDLPEPWGPWERIDAGADTCLGQKCPQFDRCFLTRMRRRAQEADILVVNHHLLLSDLVLKASAFGAVIPPYGLLIVDEAHLLEEVATSHLGRGLSSWQIADLASDAAAFAAAPGALAPEEGAALSAAAREIRNALASFQSRFESFEGRFSLAAARGEPPLLAAGKDLRLAVEDLARVLEALRAPGDASEGLRGRAAETTATLRFLLEGEDDTMVLWGEKRGRGLFLNASPIDVSARLNELLFRTVDAVALTSATLTVDGSFEFVQSRLGLGGSGTLALPSPFDLEAQSVLFVPRDLPEPADPEFPAASGAILESLLEVTRGRAFVLFTAFASLRRARERLEGRVPWPLLSQGEAPRHVLLERFRATPNAVLLATSSFWQGVDVPGEALSLVVIEKLPFDVPSDPIVAARCESIRRRGGSPFLEFQVPAAAIDLKQGLGRLLRTKTDRGVLAILDARLRTRRYGETFLRSLPPYPIVDSLDAIRAFFHGAEGGGSRRPGARKGRPRARATGEK